MADGAPRTAGVAIRVFSQPETTIIRMDIMKPVLARPSHAFTDMNSHRKWDKGTVIKCDSAIRQWHRNRDGLITCGHRFHVQHVRLHAAHSQTIHRSMVYPRPNTISIDSPSQEQT